MSAHAGSALARAPWRARLGGALFAWGAALQFGGAARLLIG